MTLENEYKSMVNQFNQSETKKMLLDLLLKDRYRRNQIKTNSNNSRKSVVIHYENHYSNKTNNNNNNDEVNSKEQVIESIETIVKPLKPRSIEKVVNENTKNPAVKKTAKVLKKKGKSKWLSSLRSLGYTTLVGLLLSLQGAQYNRSIGSSIAAGGYRGMNIKSNALKGNLSKLETKIGYTPPSTRGKSCPLKNYRIVNGKKVCTMNENDKDYSRHTKDIQGYYQKTFSKYAKKVRI